MANPTSPNYKQGVGRLTTDRYDFQKHVDGEDFIHIASSLELSPPIVVNGNSKTTVQSALEAINALVPQIIPDATTSVKGLVLISGDINGSGSSATNIKVGGIQGRAISTLAPNNNDVLTWDGSLNLWKPQATSVATTFANITVTGTASLNYLSLSGTAQLANLSVIGSYSLSGGGSNSISSGTLTLAGTSSTTITGASGTLSIALGPSNIQVNGYSSFNDQVDFNDNVIIGDLSFSNNCTINSFSFFKQTARFEGDVEARQIVRFSTDSGRLLHNGIVANNANQTINIREYKYIHIPSTLTGSRSYTIDATGLVDGDWFTVMNASGFGCLILGVVTSNISAGQFKKILRIAGTWRLVEIGS